MEGPKPNVHCLFHEGTNTACYVVSCPETKKCAVVDPIMDFDSVNLKTSGEHVDKVCEYITSNSLDPIYILETHVHADHLTGAQLLLRYFPNCLTGIGFNITQVQKTFANIFNFKDMATDGSQFGKLIQDGEEFQLGNVKCKGMHTPGHTPACMTYIMGDAVFSGDTIFMPDYGTSRCDFPGGSAEQLYDSIMKIYSLPDECRLFVGHDYVSESRKEIRWETTIGEEKSSNKQLNASTPKQEFVDWRTNRDSGLNLPRLITQSLQVNLLNGKLPEPEDNGFAYLKIPINALK